MFKIRVMTYNVHSCIGMDGVPSTERIAAVIARSGADVIALQEVDRGLARSGHADQGHEIARILEMTFHFHPSLRLKEGRYGNAVLSRFPMRLVKGGPLPTPRAIRRRERRGILWVEIKPPEKRPIQVLTSHFGLTGGERMVQVDRVLGPEWLGNSDCRSPLILCGDFNASSRSKVYGRLIDVLHDAQESLPGWRAKKTWPCKYPLVRIDHIFISEDILVERVDVPQDAITRVASDHLPLIADLSIRDAVEDEIPSRSRFIQI